MDCLILSCGRNGYFKLSINILVLNSLQAVILLDASNPSVTGKLGSFPGLIT